jgi:3-methyl-2-oxobutanoate hydroxymethyltransferase
MKKTIQDINSKEDAIVCLTAYTAPIASIADNYCDLLLVGDSVSMVLYGEETTQKADMPMMIRHGKAVAKTAQRAVVVVDMPFGTYEKDKEKALQNARQIMMETGCDAVKMEGGKAISEIMQYLTENDIPVMGHIGLLPQSVNTPKDYKVQGRDVESAKQIMEDIRAIEKAGAFAVVIEAVPEPLAAALTAAVNIPTIGIGASNVCDGQILVTEDMLGYSTGRVPKFVREYATLSLCAGDAISHYAKDVRSRAFPSKEYTYEDKAAPAVKKAS